MSYYNAKTKKSPSHCCNVFLVLPLIYADLNMKKCITVTIINDGNKKKKWNHYTQKMLDGPTGFVSFMQNKSSSFVT